MKTFLGCFFVLIGVGAWQGYSVYQSQVSSDQTALAAEAAQIESLKKQTADLSKGLADARTDNTRLASQLGSANKALDETRAAAAVQARVFVPPSPLPSQPHWTWITTDGKVYNNVVITKVEADCVTILDDDGGALVPIATLPPEIQKLCNYDPTLAPVAAAKRAEDERTSEIALGQERQVQEQKEAAEQVAEQQQHKAEQKSWSRAQLQEDIAQAQNSLNDIAYQSGLAQASGQKISKQQYQDWSAEKFELNARIKEDQAAMSQVASQ